LEYITAEGVAEKYTGVDAVCYRAPNILHTSRNHGTEFETTYFLETHPRREQYLPSGLSDSINASA
jgi:hypothetical protein